MTKLWMTQVENPEAALRESLGKLQISYVDIYLIHWPVHFFYFKNPKPLHILWAEMEALVDQGLTKAIGISNFNMLLIMDLLSYARHKPVVNQIELNPFLN